MGLGDLGHDRDVGGAGVGSSGLVGMGWSWGIFGHSEGGFGVGGPLGTAGMFWGDLGHRGMGDLWAEWGWVGDLWAQ